MSRHAIGGYFELPLVSQQEKVMPQAARFQSARSAFLALLRFGKPRRVWMPYYLCDSMYAPLREAGIPWQSYSLDEGFEIDRMPDLREGDWLYYVNYFGICDGKIDALLQRYNPLQVVLDHCQAFYSQPRPCLANIYSPRKFFGVPDGGLLVTALPVEEPAQEDTESIARASYLLKRFADTPEAGYSDYQASEQSLENMEPRRMSRLTERLLSSVPLNEAMERRTANFEYLHQRLSKWNRCAIPETVNAPLCYPLLVKVPGLREHLIGQRIFVPKYWPDVKNSVEEGSAEHAFTNCLLPLPCDQRYGVEDMARIADTCIDYINRNCNS